MLTLYSIYVSYLLVAREGYSRKESNPYNVLIPQIVHFYFHE